MKYRGNIKNNVYTVWESRGLSKKDFCIFIPADKIDDGLKNHCNSEHVIYHIVRMCYFSAVNKWINNSKSEILRKIRESRWEDDKLSAGTMRDIDEVCRIVKTLYKKQNGEKPMTTFEKRGKHNGNKQTMGNAKQ